MQFLTVECSNKTEIDISTAREQKGLGAIGVRHSGQQVVYKVLVHHVVRHSRPALVRVTFVSFINHYYFVTRGPLNPGGIVALHWHGSGNTFPVFSPRGFFDFSYPAVSQRIVSLQSISCCYCSTCMQFMLAAGARPRETKINLMDCICMCSEVEMLLIHYSTFQHHST